MSGPSPEFQPRRFRSTVPFYARYRLGYPNRLVRRAAALAGLGSSERVLDLGCGPGLLALPFARIGADVVAVDPEPDMLAVAREAAESEGLRIDFREGSSFDLPADLGTIKMVVMGRSFHWMDRAATLQVFERIVARDGAVALFGEHHPPTRENGWRAVARQVASRYEVDQESYRELWRGPEGLGHEAYLFNSAFRDLQGVSEFTRVELTADDIVGRVLSLSPSSPERLGDRRAAFEADLRKALADFAPDGRFAEIAEMQATIARRP
jgi:ubiquinone/menaquinone biosynthesis C-methylase UbiE